jgi:hypothetical protein
MLFWLAKVCRDARIAAGRRQVHIAVRVGAKAVDSSTIARFERAEVWPRNADEMVAAYADDLDLEPRVLWSRAIRCWLADGTPPVVSPDTLGPSP